MSLKDRKQIHPGEIVVRKDKPTRSGDSAILISLRFDNGLHMFEYAVWIRVTVFSNTYVKIIPRTCVFVIVIFVERLFFFHKVFRFFVVLHEHYSFNDDVNWFLCLLSKFQKNQSFHYSIVRLIDQDTRRRIKSSDTLPATIAIPRTPVGTYRQVL